jgi:hypothetical protein
MTLALAHGGDEILTIEGLAGGAELHPVQAASSNTMRSSAASARRDKSCRPWPAFARDTRPPTPGARMDERKYLPLRFWTRVRPYLAGGTELLNLLKERIATPARVVDNDTLRIGALARMSDVAADVGLRAAFPAISEALELSASPQLRNMASMGGNLLQRTRCPYFRAPMRRAHDHAPNRRRGARRRSGNRHDGAGRYRLARRRSDIRVVEHGSASKASANSGQPASRLQSRGGLSRDRQTRPPAADPARGSARRVSEPARFRFASARPSLSIRHLDMLRPIGA